jgi:AcrR family transcriptional regulator
MTSIADKTTRPVVRRSRDAHASREALLGAARALFDQRGYDRATTREIGERAGVDPALIARYFGSKEGLYLATIAEGPIGASSELDFDPGALVAQLLEHWDERGHSPISRALASPTLTDEVREQVRAVIDSRLIDPLAAELAGRGVAAPALRAELLVAITLGVAVSRSNRTLATLASAPADAVLEALSPLVEALQAQHHGASAGRRDP